MVKARKIEVTVPGDTERVFVDGPSEDVCLHESGFFIIGECLPGGLTEPKKNSGVRGRRVVGMVAVFNVGKAFLTWLWPMGTKRHCGEEEIPIDNGLYYWRPEVKRDYRAITGRIRQNGGEWQEEYTARVSVGRFRDYWAEIDEPPSQLIMSAAEFESETQRRQELKQGVLRRSWEPCSHPYGMWGDPDYCGVCGHRRR